MKPSESLLPADWSQAPLFHVLLQQSGFRWYSVMFWVSQIVPFFLCYRVLDGGIPWAQLPSLLAAESRPKAPGRRGTGLGARCDHQHSGYCQSGDTVTVTHGSCGLKKMPFVASSHAAHNTCLRKLTATRPKGHIDIWFVDIDGVWT